LSELYNLERDFILCGVKNFSIIGNHSTLKCMNSTIGIAIGNATNIVVQGVKVVQCSKNYTNFVTNTFQRRAYLNMPKFQWNAAIHLHYCGYIIINNVSIIVDAGTNGLVIINSMIRSDLINVAVLVTSSQSGKHHNSITNGLVVYYHGLIHLLPEFTYLYVENFTYKEDFCQSIDNVILFLLEHSYYPTFIATITNTMFKDLYNSHVLYYYSVHSFTPPKIHFIHCQFFNNTESIFATFYDISGSCKHSAVIYIYHSMFYSNNNTSSMITIKSSSPRCPYALIIKCCNFTFNHIQNIIKDINEFGEQWRRPACLHCYL